MQTATVKKPEFGERMYRVYHQYTDVNLDNLENFKLVNQTLWLRVPPISRNCAKGRRSFSASNLSFGVIETAFGFSQSGGHTRTKGDPLKEAADAHSGSDTH